MPCYCNKSSKYHSLEFTLSFADQVRRPEVGFQLRDECLVTITPSRRICQVRLDERILKVSECNAFEIRDCEVDFVSVIGESARTIIETESELDEECTEFGGVRSVERIGLADFRARTISLTLHISGERSDCICQIVLHVLVVVVVGIVMLGIGTFIIGRFIVGIFRIAIPRTIITKVIISGNAIQVIRLIIAGGLVRVALFAGFRRWAVRNVSSESNAWSCSGISGVSGGATCHTGCSGLGGLRRHVSELRKVESMSSNILLRTVHPTDSYYAKSGRTSEYRSIGVSDLSKKGRERRCGFSLCAAPSQTSLRLNLREVGFK